MKEILQQAYTENPDIIREMADSSVWEGVAEAGRGLAEVLSICAQQ